MGNPGIYPGNGESGNKAIFKTGNGESGNPEKASRKQNFCDSSAGDVSRGGLRVRDCLVSGPQNLISLVNLFS